jgi:hypothetical protein
MAVTEGSTPAPSTVDTPPVETPAQETPPVPSGKPPDATFSFTNDEAPKADFLKIVPDEYKDKPWVQNLLKAPTPTKEFFKQHEEVQKLIGSRPQGIVPPGVNATAEETKAFYKSLGVPDDIKMYTIESPAWAEDEKAFGDIIEKTRRNDVLDDMRKLAMAEGITPKQFQNSIKGFEKAQVKVLKDIQKANVEAILKRDKDFQESVQKEYGEKWNNKVQAGKAIIDKFGSDRVKKAFGNYDNEQGLALLELLGNVHDNLVKGDTFIGTKGEDSGIVTPGKTDEDVRQEIRTLMSKPEYTNPTHGEHKALVAKVRKLQDSREAFIKR